MRPTIRVELVYALPRAQTVIPLGVLDATPVEEAVRQSGLLERHPEIQLDRAMVGIWGRPVHLATPLRDGDRIEIYRPLAADPKEVRRRPVAGRRDRGPGVVGG